MSQPQTWTVPPEHLNEQGINTNPGRICSYYQNTHPPERL